MFGNPIQPARGAGSDNLVESPDTFKPREDL